MDTLFISRGEKLAYRIETREDRLPADTVVRLASMCDGCGTGWIGRWWGHGGVGELRFLGFRRHLPSGFLTRLD